MRKLSPTKAITHALNSVLNYRQVAARIGLVWLPVLLLTGIAEIYAGPPDPRAETLTPAALVQLASGIVSIIAVCSMAVGWHRFILRDELGPGLRLDGNVMRYAGNTILIMLAMVVPSLLFIVSALVAPAAAAIGLPAVALIGGLVTRLSVKLPAVALGNRGFSFRDAWAATEGNFWQCLGVFLLNSAVMLGGFLLLLLVGGGVGQVSPMLGEFVTTAGSILLQLFFAFFNASVLTSLYGFFVERRDF